MRRAATGLETLSERRCRLEAGKDRRSGGSSSNGGSDNEGRSSGAACRGDTPIKRARRARLTKENRKKRKE